MLKRLNLIELDAFGLNQYGVLDPFGQYQVNILGDHLIVYYEGIVVYDSNEH
jgi:hypothetical protein